MLASAVSMDVGDLQRLHEVVTRAIEATTVDGVAKVLVDEGMAVLGVPIAGVWLVNGNTLESVYFGGSPIGPWESVPLAGDSPLAVCVRRQEPEWLLSTAEYAARFPESAARMTQPVACVCLPLVANERSIGGAVFASLDSLELSEDERTTLTLIARQCAHALERLRLIDLERKARRDAEQLAQRMNALQAAGARLAAARGMEHTARTIIDDVRAALGGSGVGLWLVEDDVASLFAHEGLPEDIIAAASRLHAGDASPLAKALQTSQPTWIERDEAAAHLHAGANVPLIAEGRLIGAFFVTFDRPHDFDVGDREFLEVYAVHAAQALDRVRLVEATNKLAGRMTALQAIAARLGEARGFDEVTRIVIEEATAAIEASTAALWELDGREIVLCAQVGSPSSVVDAMSRIHVDEVGALPTAVRTRTPQYLENRAAAAGKGQYNAARWAAIEAAAFVPLVARNRLLGVIGLGFS